MRATSPCNASSDVSGQFRLGARGSVRGVFTHLRPHEFRGIEFGRTGRERIHVNARVSGEKRLDLAAAMDRMLVPDHHDGTANWPQQMFQKSNDVLPVQGLPSRLQTQLELAPTRRDTHRPDQSEALGVLDAGAQHRRLAARGPGPFERRDQRKAAFIGKNQMGL